jgi:hypothetical protein
MGERTDQIEIELDRTREELKSNLEELEMRARDAADWRSHFQKHPGPMVVAAMVGGVLLSAMLGRR